MDNILTIIVLVILFSLLFREIGWVGRADEFWWFEN